MTTVILSTDKIHLTTFTSQRCLIVKNGNYELKVNQTLNTYYSHHKEALKILGLLSIN